MDGAAVKGHLGVVKWLFENRSEGCSAATIAKALSEIQHEVFKFLLANYETIRARPENKSAIRAAMENRLHLEEKNRLQREEKRIRASLEAKIRDEERERIRAEEEAKLWAEEEMQELLKEEVKLRTQIRVEYEALAEERIRAEIQHQVEENLRAEIREMLRGGEKQICPICHESPKTTAKTKSGLTSVCQTLVSVLIGDNCPTNKATADMLGVRLIGCACHKLNLAIQKLIAKTPGTSDAIARVRSMVIKATNLKAAAALRDLTELVPLLNNDTRWSSTYRMIERFFKIEKELRLVDEVEVPRNAEVQVLRDLMPKLEKLDSITVDLHTQGTTVADARGTLDIVLDDFPELSHYLAQDAAIVHDPSFESGVIKVLNGQSGRLSGLERQLMKPFEVAQQTRGRSIDWGKTRTYAEEVKERKRQRLEQVTEYQDLSYMLGTSTSVERLFSIAKYVMPAHRERMSTWMFENIMFLKTNRDLWTSKTVAIAIRDARAANAASSAPPE